MLAIVRIGRPVSFELKQFAVHLPKLSLSIPICLPRISILSSSCFIVFKNLPYRRGTINNYLIEASPVLL